MKKLSALLAALFALTALVACSEEPVNGGNGSGGNGNANVPVDTTCKVRFMTNSPDESAELYYGTPVQAENVLYFATTVRSGEKVTAPYGQPERAGYVFDGWATDKNGTALYDFNAPVTETKTLYAKWSRDESVVQEEYVEPTLSFKERIIEGIPMNLYGVLNETVTNGAVRLFALGIRILTEHAENVKELLNYTRAAATEILSATYSGGKVNLSYKSGGETETITINVVDDSANLTVDNSTYESKAKNYEKKSIKPYSVIMGGSSSMENWSTSVEDMAPVTTINVGIGGTTVEQWTGKLNKRLVYPHSPRAVVYYVGINNIINAGDSGEEAGNKLVALFDDVHDHLPETTIYFIMINYVPGYTKYYSDIAVANEMVLGYAENKDYMCLIDAGEGLIKKSGKTNKAYFLSDGLHMSLCGYELWGAAVKEAFIAHEKELYR